MKERSTLELRQKQTNRGQPQGEDGPRGLPKKRDCYVTSARGKTFREIAGGYLRNTRKVSQRVFSKGTKSSIGTGLNRGGCRSPRMHEGKSGQGIWQERPQRRGLCKNDSSVRKTDSVRLKGELPGDREITRQTTLREKGKATPSPKQGCAPGG